MVHREMRACYGVWQSAQVSPDLLSGAIRRSRRSISLLVFASLYFIFSIGKICLFLFYTTTIVA